ncbi:MAG: hypothetical protein PUK40_03930 [Actinomycetaceae bacterium]|nr:hypothetical protein [Arcanobacterium sp.]MDD7505087.1 hypothetical protein [Actinomycetaceae bacterium]MDY6142604.1 hypothetical protein [Arcanobacterium sp.]
MLIGSGINLLTGIQARRGEVLISVYWALSAQWLARSINDPLWCAQMWADEPPSGLLLQAQENATEALPHIVDTDDPTDLKATVQQYTNARSVLEKCAQ